MTNTIILWTHKKLFFYIILKWWLGMFWGSYEWFSFFCQTQNPQIWIFKKWKNFLTILRVSHNFVVTAIPLCTNTYQSKCTYFILQITCTVFDRVPSPILYIFGFVVGDYHRFHDFFFAWFAYWLTGSRVVKIVRMNF